MRAASSAASTAMSCFRYLCALISTNKHRYLINSQKGVIPMAAAKTQTLPNFKGKPLVRSGNVLYYGDPSEKYIAMMQVLSTKSFEDVTLADRVSVQILSTDESVHTSQRVVKRTEKQGLYTALNIAAIWLDRQLSAK